MIKEMIVDKNFFVFISTLPLNRFMSSINIIYINNHNKIILICQILNAGIIKCFLRLVFLLLLNFLDI